MKRIVMPLCLLAAAATFAVVTVGAEAAAPPARGYTATVVSSYADPAGFDDYGDYLAARVDFFNEVSLIRSDGRSIDLQPPRNIDPTSVFADALSDHGRSAGEFYAIFNPDPDTAYSATRAITWDRNGTPTLLPTPGQLDSQASGVNDRGTAVGVIDKHAVLWRNGRAKDLGPDGTAATEINDRGRIEGSVRLGTADWAAVFDGRGGYRTLGRLAGATATEVTDLADTDVSVGSTTIGGVEVPTYWDARGRAHRMRGTDVPSSINDHDVVVGGRVVWQRPNAAPQTLPLVQIQDGRRLQGYATDVNNRGVIIGSGVVPDDGGVDSPGRNYDIVVKWTRS